MTTKNDNVVSLDRAARARNPNLRAEAEALISPVRGDLVGHSRQLLQDLFDNVDDALFERASKAESNTDANLYFDAMRAVRRQREQVEHTFLRSLVNTYDRFWIAESTELLAAPVQEELEEPAPDELSLVDEIEIEENLAVTSMTGKARSLHRAALFALDQRIAHLAGVASLAEDANPLGPRTMCLAFHESLRGVNLGVKVKLVVYKLFDRYYISPLGKMYGEINTRYAEAGILPHIAHGVVVGGGTGRQSPSDHPSAVRQEDAQTSASASSATSNEAMSAQVFATLQDLLRVGREEGMLGSPCAQPGSGSPPEVCETADVLSGLSSLQQIGCDLTLEAAARFKSALLEQVAGSATGDSRLALGPAEEDAIDVVALLFEFILDDRNLPDAMRALLSRLQIPVLKVAIMDKSFFSDAHHGARRLLNELAQAAIGWTAEDGRGPSSLYGRIESVVDRVIQDFRHNVEIFEELLEGFDNDISGDLRGAEFVEGRTAQAAEGRERLALAREEVAQRLGARLQGCSLPADVRDMLEEGWQTLLVLNFLREGEDSTAWRDAWDTMDELIWSVSSGRSSGDQKRLMLAIPSLLRRLREGLAAISYDPHETTNFFKSLQDIHFLRLSGVCGSSLGAPVDGAEPLSDADAVPRAVAATDGTCDILEAVAGDGAAMTVDFDLAESAQVEQTPELADADHLSAMDEEAPPQGGDEHDRKADLIAVGTWLEFRNVEGRRLRAKLAWKSDLTATLLFVNRKGVKVAEKNIPGLAVELRRGSAVVLENLPLIDRALDAVVHTLSRDVTTATEPRNP
jgi:hypothetical protein